MSGVDVEASALVAAPAPDVFGMLDDLSTYPRWLGIVSNAARASPLPLDEGPAWVVELVARLGPISRRKRVRMVRTLHRGDNGEVRFERQEGDGRDHSPWVLTGLATPDDAAGAGPSQTRVNLHIHYGGSSRLPGMDILLRQEAKRAGERLESLLQRPDQGAAGA